MFILNITRLGVAKSLWSRLGIGLSFGSGTSYIVSSWSSSLGSSSEIHFCLSFSGLGCSLLLGSLSDYSSTSDKALLRLRLAFTCRVYFLGSLTIVHTSDLCSGLVWDAPWFWVIRLWRSSWCLISPRLKLRHRLRLRSIGKSFFYIHRLRWDIQSSAWALIEV